MISCAAIRSSEKWGVCPRPKTHKMFKICHSSCSCLFFIVIPGMAFLHIRELVTSTFYILSPLCPAHACLLARPSVYSLRYSVASINLISRDFCPLLSVVRVVSILFWLGMCGSMYVCSCYCSFLLVDYVLPGWIGASASQLVLIIYAGVRFPRGRVTPFFGPLHELFCCFVRVSFFLLGLEYRLVLALGSAHTEALQHRKAQEAICPRIQR